MEENYLYFILLVNVKISSQTFSAPEVCKQAYFTPSEVSVLYFVFIMFYFSLLNKIVNTFIIKISGVKLKTERV